MASTALTARTLTVVVLANYSPINYFLREDYSYSNIDGSFTFSEEGGKGFNYESTIKAYSVFLYTHPAKDIGDNRLFRTFTIKPWCFWEWHDMLFSSGRFRLPYLTKQA